jgi:hypothetical protein
MAGRIPLNRLIARYDFTDPIAPPLMPPRRSDKGAGAFRVVKPYPIDADMI